MARQAITLAGAFIGTAVGFPQAGFLIGSIVGGLVDPQVIKAPSIGDISQQTSSEGVPCPLYAGTAGGAGNLVYASEPDIVDGGTVGKGGPQQEEPDRAYVTFIIRIGASLFDGPGYRAGITSLIKVWEDEKLVYDVSPTSVILEESAEYAEGFTFYPGTETQLPDPDVEAIEGVGNVPAYRGRAIFVKKRHDVTDRRGSLPSYRFEVSVNGSPSPATSGWFAGPVAGAGAAGGSESFYVRASTAQELPFATPIPYPSEMVGGLTRISVANGAIFFHASVVGAVSFDGGDTWTQLTIGLSQQYNVFWNGNYYYNGTFRSLDGENWETVPGLPSLTAFLVATEYQNILVAVRNPSVPGASISVSLDDGGNWTDYPAADFSNLPISYVTPGKMEQFKFTLDADIGWSTANMFEDVNIEGFGFKQPYYSNASDDVWMRRCNASITRRSENGGSTWEEAITIAGIGDGNVEMAWGDFTWTILRQAGGAPSQIFLNYSEESGVLGSWTEVATPLYGSVVAIAYAGTSMPGTVTAGATTFEQVVLAAGRRCKVPDSAWNLPGLDEKTIRGCVVASQNYTAQDFINSLRLVFPSDGACFDGKIHINLRGGAIDAELDEEYLVDEQDDGEQDETLRNADDKRKAPIRRPYKVNLMFPNAKVGYNLTKATSPNYGDRGDAVSETTLEIPVVLDETTEAPQLADVLDKIGRMEALGELVRIFPEGETAKLVSGSTVRLTAGDLVRRTRVQNSRAGDGTKRLHLFLDSAHAYSSQATAQPGIEWPAPPPSLAGDTTFALMNLPVLADSQDLMGLHIAIRGDVGSAWRGAGIEYRVSGTTAWTSLGSFTRSAIMGSLITELPPASEFYTDTTNALRVRLLGDEEIETLTDAEWLSEGNPAAIVYPDGTAEVLQPRDAQDDGDREWTLTTLQRARLATVADTHAIGSTFVMLDGSIFLPIPSALIGQTLEFRVTSIGNRSETAPTASIVWDPVVLQTEFPPAELDLVRAGDDITASVVPRHRLGTELLPIPSNNFTGYRWTATDGANSATVDTAPTAPATTFDCTGWASPITVTVAQTNRYTVAGPAISEDIA